MDLRLCSFLRRGFSDGPPSSSPPKYHTQRQKGKKGDFGEEGMKRLRFARSLLVLLFLISSAFSPSDALELRWARRGKGEKAGAADGRGRGKKNPGVPTSILAWPAFTDSGEIASDVAKMNWALSKKREKTKGGPAGRAPAGPRRRDAGGGVARGILQWGKLLLATLGLKAGSEATFSGDLLAASARGDETLIYFFLSCGASVNARGAHGETPLMQAAAGGHAGAVKLLIERGADARLRDEEGLTARRHAKLRKDQRGDAIAKTLPLGGLLSGLLTSPTSLSLSISRSTRILSGWDGRIHVPWRAIMRLPAAALHGIMHVPAVALHGIMHVPTAALHGVMMKLPAAARLGESLYKRLGSGGGGGGAGAALLIGWAFIRMLKGDFDHLMVLH